MRNPDRCFVRSPFSGRQRRRRRGAIVVLAAFLLVLMLAVIAFALDLGCVLLARTELQRTADAAAVAAAWDLIDEAAIVGDPGLTAAMANARTTAGGFAGRNTVLGKNPGLDLNPANHVEGEVVIGAIADLGDPNAPLTFAEASKFNAVRVKVRRSASQNGQIALHFARVLGYHGLSIEAEATAAVARNIQGFRIPSDGSNLPILPITVDEQSWNELVSGGEVDDFGWDPETRTVRSEGDRIPEIDIYPQPIGAAGNRGTVKIGVSNNSTKVLSRQIRQGISPDDLAAHGGKLSFEGGDAFTLEGNPGISAGIKDELASIIGQTRAIPIFRSVSGNGNNAQFTIVKFVGVRIMEVELTGGNKRLVVQPAPVITKGGILADSDQESKSDYIFSAARLVK